MKFNRPSQCSVLGKDPSMCWVRCLKFDAWCLFLSAVFSRFYAIIFFIISKHLSLWWSLLSFLGRRVHMCVLLCFPLLWRKVCLTVRVGGRGGETHPELSMRHQLRANTRLNICQTLNLRVIVVQMCRILYSISWQSHSLVLLLVKNPHVLW